MKGGSGLPAAGLIVLALAAGACGGEDAAGPKVASTGSAAAAPSAGKSGGSKKADALAYSRCMRGHGVPNFPDPDGDGRIKIEGGRDSSGRVTGVDPNSAQFKSAQSACRSLQKAIEPSEAEKARMRVAAVKYSACMRANGVPKFPDPMPDGGMQLRAGPETGIYPESAQFKAAERACRKHSPDGKDDGAPKTEDKGGS